PPRSTLLPYTTLFRSSNQSLKEARNCKRGRRRIPALATSLLPLAGTPPLAILARSSTAAAPMLAAWRGQNNNIPGGSLVQLCFRDRKSTRLNSSHVKI